MEAWDWEVVEPEKLAELDALRLCPLGGVRRPWDCCEFFEPLLEGAPRICEAGVRCEFEGRCPKAPRRYVV